MSKETAPYHEKQRQSAKETYLAGKSHISIDLLWRPVLWEMIQQNNVVLPLQMTVQTLQRPLVCVQNAFLYLVSTERPFVVLYNKVWS